MRVEICRPKGEKIYLKVLEGRERMDAHKCYLYNIGIIACRTNEEPTIINFHEVTNKEFANNRLDSLIDTLLDKDGEYKYQRHEIISSWCDKIIKVTDYDIILRKNTSPIIIDHSNETSDEGE